jgi:hypothetical protein
VRDRIEQLLWDSQLSVAIMGDLARGDVEFIGLNAPLSDGLLGQLRERGLTLIGVVALVGGKVRTALEVPLDERTSFALAQASIAYLVTRLGFNPTPETKDDFQDFMGRLIRLEDPRKG